MNTLMFYFAKFIHIFKLPVIHNLAIHTITAIYLLNLYLCAPEWPTKELAGLSNIECPDGDGSNWSTADETGKFLQSGETSNSERITQKQTQSQNE